MPTYSEIDITFTDAFEPNTATNSFVIAYSDSLNGTSTLIQQQIVTTRSGSNEFTTGTDAATQAQFYKDALDLDLVPLGDWEVSISGATVTIKSNLEYITFVNDYAGLPNDTRYNTSITNYSTSIPQTEGIIPVRSNYYITRDTTDAAITSQEVSMWFLTDTIVSNLPSEPDYKATQLRPSTNWTSFDFAISSYARDYLNPTLPELAVGGNASREGSVISVSVSTKNNTEAINQPIINQAIATLGYSSYNTGAQPIYDQDILLSSTRHQVKAGENIVIPAYTLGDLTEIVMKDSDGNTLATEVINTTDLIVDAVSYFVFSTNGISGDYVTINDTYRFELINECTYDTEVIYFLNRYGVFEGFTFFKATKNSIDVTKGDTFKNNYVIGGQYDTKRHLYRSTGANGRESMQYTTGYINEQQNAAIEDILLSEYIYKASGEPIDVDTSSIEKKTRVVDKLISYDISFKRSEDLIQTV